MDESVKFDSVVLGGRLLAEFEPAFLGVALHGAPPNLREGWQIASIIYLGR